MATTIFTFPFEQLGTWLRDLSLSGTAGNIAAIILYTGICLLPVAVWLILKKKKKDRKGDLLLFLLSAACFYILYYSINPGLFETILPGARGLYLSGLFYSILVTYGVVRIQSMAMHGDRHTLHKLMKLFLILLGIVFGAIVFLELAITMPAAMENTREYYESIQTLFVFAGAEASIQLNLGLMEAVTFMQSLTQAVPYVLDIVLIWQAYLLMNELQKDWYSEESVAASGKLAVTAGRNLVIVAILGMCDNLLQIFGRNGIKDVNLTVSIPILSILFMLAVLLAARYIRASQEIKTENDMFI